MVGEGIEPPQPETFGLQPSELANVQSYQNKRYCRVRPFLHTSRNYPSKRELTVAAIAMLYFQQSSTPSAVLQALERIRTSAHLIRSQALCPLSYKGVDPTFAAVLQTITFPFSTQKDPISRVLSCRTDLRHERITRWGSPGRWPNWIPACKYCGDTSFC